MTDNDGSVEKLEAKYVDYLYTPVGRIKIHFDIDEKCKTLEPQLLKANSLQVLNGIFGKHCTLDEEMCKYMEREKTECALKIFSSGTSISFPKYITDAID